MLLPTIVSENLQNEFLRQITNLKKSTPIYMLYAELGRMPAEVTVKSRMIGYWLSLVNGKERYPHCYTKSCYTNTMLVVSING